jgi:hypothetical protein
VSDPDDREEVADPWLTAAETGEELETEKAPHVRGFLHVPEKTRTSTYQSVHKALKLDRRASIR